jgi:thiol-disulfide isomerase/thioredoxin
MRDLNAVGLALIVLTLISFASDSGFAAMNLKLNPALNYSSDSNDGPLITGEDMQNGLVKNGKPTYIIFYHRECYNSKRQARRTIELYDKYMGRVDFIVVDLDSSRSKEQNDLVKKYYRNYIPHVTIVDKKGEIVYDKSGEVGNGSTSDILDKLL